MKTDAGRRDGDCTRMTAGSGGGRQLTLVVRNAATVCLRHGGLGPWADIKLPTALGAPI